MFIPTLDTLADIADKTITGDALLTQRKLAQYIVSDRLAHYVFTAKDNQLTLAGDIRLAFENRKAADFSEPYTVAHGRIESRSIWTSTLLNDYLDFPFVSQIFAIHRHTIDKKKRQRNQRYCLRTDQSLANERQRRTITQVQSRPLAC